MIKTGMLVILFISLVASVVLYKKDSRYQEAAALCTAALAVINALVAILS